MNYSFRFQNINLFKEANLKGSFIWILYANKIPPHIGISTANQYFSLKTEGKDEAVNVSSVEKVVNAKQIALVLVELKNDLKVDEVEAIFNQYSEIPDNSSCLEPIEKVVNEKLEISSISNLLKELEKKNRVKNYFGLNLPEDYAGISAYGKKEIDERISKLKNAKREKNIS